VAAADPAAVAAAAAARTLPVNATRAGAPQQPHVQPAACNKQIKAEQQQPSKSRGSFHLRR
jgi:hypothetical protein